MDKCTGPGIIACPLLATFMVSPLVEPCQSARMGISSAELRKQSLIALAWARQARADAEAARLRAVRCRTRVTAAALSVVARIHATKAATRQACD